ncbi:hypothetical protein CKAH01_07096 [Colletotrichum kahawae]|uniref:Uncharacterized protein n=1 Tax=Colletotrichum kahawae TaxID=34407 RepID=A0AAE0D1G8_COLKA|nr:hypothetical protein CKAH01_07096 [Colletotrichum kahawae]
MVLKKQRRGKTASTALLRTGAGLPSAIALTCCLRYLTSMHGSVREPSPGWPSRRERENERECLLSHSHRTNRETLVDGPVFLGRSLTWVCLNPVQGRVLIPHKLDG